MAILSYALCIVISLLCAFLLTRGYMRSRSRLLLWSSLCFWGLFLSNCFLIVDLVLLPSVDLFPVRLSLNLASVLLLVVGLIWESR
jgi:hypothetical protein